MTCFWGISGHPSFLEKCSVVLQLNSDNFVFSLPLIGLLRAEKQSFSLRPFYEEQSIWLRL